MTSTEADDATRIGFIGLGLMGSAMAANLQRRARLVVWNRTPSACTPLGEAGAEVAASPAAVFERARVVFVMLSDESAIDAVLRFDGSLRVRDRTIVLMSTVSPAYSERLARRIADAGGAYVEAPVSGSRQPAVEGSLIAMLAGEAASLDAVEPLLGAMCSRAVRCGAVPAALTTKLAVNTLLITLVTGLAEAFHFAEENGVDPAVLRVVLDAGPMSSAVSSAKSAKLVARDWAPHAAIADVLKNSRLVRDQARRSGSSAPLMEVCTELYAEAVALGHAGDDMAAVISALRERAGSAGRAGAPERPRSPADRVDLRGG